MSIGDGGGGGDSFEGVERVDKAARKLQADRDDGARAISTL